MNLRLLAKAGTEEGGTLVVALEVAAVAAGEDAELVLRF